MPTCKVCLYQLKTRDVSKAVLIGADVWICGVCTALMDRIAEDSLYQVTIPSVEDVQRWKTNKVGHPEAWSLPDGEWLRLHG